MARPLSLDLRERVVAAVAGGLSRRQAAERFGVSAASAVRRTALDRDKGGPAAKPQGGDRHSHRIEAQAELILSLTNKTRDMTLVELPAALAERGPRVRLPRIMTLPSIIQIPPPESPLGESIARKPYEIPTPCVEWRLATTGRSGSSAQDRESIGDVRSPAQWLAHGRPYRRYGLVLAGKPARLGADAIATPSS